MGRWVLRSRRTLLLGGMAAVSIGLGAVVLAGSASNRSASRGLLDDMTDPELHGLPIPEQFEIVGKTEFPHNFDNEPTLPQSAYIVVTLRARRPVNAAGILSAVEQRLVKTWGCAYASARLNVPGYPDSISCTRNHATNGVEVEYRAADWDASQWKRHRATEIRVTIATPTPED